MASLACNSASDTLACESGLDPDRLGVASEQWLVEVYEDPRATGDFHCSVDPIRNRTKREGR